MSLLIDGKDTIIFSIGGIVNDLFQVCKKLNDINIYPSLVSCHTLKPLDKIAINDPLTIKLISNSINFLSKLFLNFINFE